MDTLEVIDNVGFAENSILKIEHKLTYLGMITTKDMSTIKDETNIKSDLRS